MDYTTANDYKRTLCADIAKEGLLGDVKISIRKSTDSEQDYFLAISRNMAYGSFGKQAREAYDYALYQSRRSVALGKGATERVWDIIA